MVSKQELNNLTKDDIELILSDQKELYSEEEILIIEETHKLLIEKEILDKINSRPEEISCPKCDGTNSSKSDKCQYCEYIFKDHDSIITNEKYDTDISEESDSNNSISLYVIAFLLPIIGIIMGLIYIGKNEDELGKSLIIFSIVMSIISSILGYIIFFAQ